MLKIIRELGVKIDLAFNKKAMEQADAGIAKIAKNMKSLGAEVAGAAATVFGFAEATAYNARDLKLYADTLGISSERLQELAYAGKIVASVSRDEMMGALEGVSSTLDAFRKGSVDAAQALNRAGVPIQALTDRTLRADQVLGMVADGLSGISDPIARTARAQEIFGASGAKLLPLLLKGSKGIAAYGQEARKLGLVFGDAQIQRQAKFQEKLNRTMEVVKHIGLVIGDRLLPVVDKILTDFSKWIVANKELVASGITEFVSGLAVVVGVAWKGVLLFVGVFQRWVKWMGGAEKAARALFTALALFHGARITMGLLQTGKAIFEVASGLTKLLPIASLLSGAFGSIKTAFMWILEIKTLKDFLPGIKGALTSLAAGFGPILAVSAGLASFAAILHDLWSVLNGGKLEDTWLGQLGNWADKKLNGALSKPGEWLYDLMHRGENNAILGNQYASAAPAGAGPGALGFGTSGGMVANTTANVTVQVPPGTSPSQAADFVSKGVEKGITDANLRRTRDQYLGGAK